MEHILSFITPADPLRLVACAEAVLIGPLRNVRV